MAKSSFPAYFLSQSGVVSKVKQGNYDCSLYAVKIFTGGLFGTVLA